MDLYQILSKKIKGGTLREEEVRFFVMCMTQGTMADYQVSAMLTAMYIHGLTTEELYALTEQMAYSGDVMPFLKDAVDKHSTGGVGDKISLICSPLIASLGMNIAKMSGRGLGHTGGTIDKLEAIPGMDVNLSAESFQKVLSRVGCVISGQTGNLCPADKKMYALRDVTATVDSLPLIASSIMSKKIASGAGNIILDVKCGHGAFMKEVAQAEQLAKLMLDIATAFQRKMVILITDMNEPLGFCIGNSLEVMEATEVLKGNEIADLTEISVAIAGYAMVMTGLESDPRDGIQKARENLQNGKALQKFCNMLKCQNADLSFIEDYGRLPQCAKQAQVISQFSGYVQEIDAQAIGMASMHIGAGRKKKEDVLDYGAGIRLHKKTGDFVEKGEVLATLYYDRETELHNAMKLVQNAFCMAQSCPKSSSKILKVMSNIDGIS